MRSHFNKTYANLNAAVYTCPKKSKAAAIGSKVAQRTVKLSSGAKTATKINSTDFNYIVKRVNKNLESPKRQKIPLIFNNELLQTTN